MKISDKYNKARTDYEYLVQHHGGEIYDITGGFIEGEHYKDLLENPTKTNACRNYIEMIDYSAANGFGTNNYNSGSIPDFEDERVLEIYRHYNLESVVSTHWGTDIYE